MVHLRYFSRPCTTLIILGLGCLLPASHAYTDRCRCTTQDSCWPAIAEWNSFNSSVHGKLIATTPLASPCHDPHYDAGACEHLREQWNLPALHDDDPSSIMAAAVANKTCNPFTARDTSCALGNMVSYAVNASSSADFASAIKFASKNNIRLVIRNTGHDYLGKSTGAHALSIWTHHLKDITFLDYTANSHYHGPAFKLLAGVQVVEAYAAADAHGMVIVGGDCPTVGVAGGYLQGGGHSPLSSLFRGMGADQVLEWEVVDGTGRLLKASRTKNPQLYWALSGGGGGSYGVVYSVTVKAHRGIPVTGVNLNFTSSNISADAFYQAIEEYHGTIPALTAAGGYPIGAITADSFSLTPLVLPNRTVHDAEALLEPLRNKLDELHISHKFEALHFPSFFSFYETMIAHNSFTHVQNAQYGGWFVPLDVIQHKNRDLTSAVRKIVEDGVGFVGVGLNVSTSNVWNAIHPGWREASMYVFLSSPWPETARLSDMAALAERMTNEWVPALSSLSPKAGAYMNEADPQQPDWKEAFYGPNYNRLLAVKRMYDPNEVFYAWTAVGSDRWAEDANGALCRVHAK
ncbi:isoamyl alcohol oxidase [Massarina eburnea CBS 473.64]|uniref:Isoamyl alcohol oxidase n=1 Tax=Massarina eburnea CBS 473.64 TaxID=1395130 RepID=A0A6A6RKP2_9PLEO|nr:isoamyl alcohol oxidase [Massarina eburnea CBS 473.64]